MSSFSTNGESPKVLIWDLGGVLIDVCWKRYAYTIGIGAFLPYMVRHARYSFHECQVRAFEVLHRVAVPEHMICTTDACIPGGALMPAVMVAYQAGFLRREEIIPLVQTTIAELSQENYFASSVEQKLISRIIDELFNPETLISCHYPIPEMVELIQSLASVLSPEGTRRYKLYVLSNWDPVSFQSIGKTSEELFSLFDGIVVSGLTGKMKPSYAIFDQLVETHDLDKASCIFIDDQQENITAARSYGIGNPLLFKNITQLKRDLVAVGVEIG